MPIGAIEIAAKVDVEFDRPVSEFRSQTIHKITPIPELIKQFPKTRYYGSKRKLLSWLYSKFSRIDFDTTLDLFGGTASVSQLFRSMHKTVTYHDALSFNSDIAATVLSDRVALTRNELTEHIGQTIPTQGLIARNFEGIFFKAEENRWLDGFMENLCESKRTM